MCSAALVCKVQQAISEEKMALCACWFFVLLMQPNPQLDMQTRWRHLRCDDRVFFGFAFDGGWLQLPGGFFSLSQEFVFMFGGFSLVDGVQLDDLWYLIKPLPF